MAIHHRVSKGKIEAELERLLRGEGSGNVPEPPPHEPDEQREPPPNPPSSRLIRELATTLMFALLLSLLLVGLKLSAPRFGLETIGLKLLERFHLGS